MARTAKQKAATKRMIAANRKRKSGKRTTARKCTTKRTPARRAPAKRRVTRRKKATTGQKLVRAIKKAVK